MGNDMKHNATLLTQPTNGTVLTMSARAFYYATKEGRDVSRHTTVGSLICHNFNRALADARNLQDQERPEYFAMIHADVWAEPGWLDALIQEMQTTRLDVLSCVVPFRSGVGLTSTALLMNGRHRRLTLQELFGPGFENGHLPPTFQASDVEGVVGLNDPGQSTLLVNTGMWIARLDALDGIWFHMRDYAVAVEGRYWPMCWSEDWTFSEDCAKHGLRVAATSKIQVWHGDPAYTHEPFGIAHDTWHDREEVS
jgi:hypothetical protein